MSYSFEKSPETDQLTDQLSNIQDTIQSDEVTQDDIQKIRQQIKDLYESQAEKLKRKIWESYNPHLPEGMRYVESTERYKEYVNTEVIKRASPVNTLQVLPDGRIVSCSADKTIRIWEGRGVK